jgi:hypothetical protein
MPASAISPATSIEAARLAPPLIEVPRVDASTARCSVFASVIDDTALNSSAATIDENSENATTGTLSPTSRSAGTCVVSGTSAASTGAACHAIATPITPPVSASTSASVSCCAASRVHAAPSAVRTAISCRRPSDRASNRLPTLAQAISSTNPTAASNSSSGRLVSPTSASRSGSAKYCEPRFCSGYFCANSVDSVSSSDTTASIDCPGRNRPSAKVQPFLRCAGAVAGSVNGMATSVGEFGGK